MTSPALGLPVELQKPVFWRLRPSWIPTRALGRIRWLFLGFTLLNVVGIQPALIWGSTAPQEWRVAGAIACLVLSGMWVRGYKRGHFPFKSVLLEFAAVLVLTLAVASPVGVLGVIYPAANFRGTYGSKRDLAAAMVALVLAFSVGRLIQDAPTSPSAFGAFITQLIGLPVTAVMMYALARNLIRHERSAAREQALARAGAELMAARTPDTAIATVLEAAHAMLAGVSVSRVTLSTSSGVDEMTVIAARGVDAKRILGTRIDLREIPTAYLNTRHEQRRFTIDANNAQSMAVFLGFAPHLGVITLTPMSVNGGSTGSLVVETAGEVPAESRDGLLTLSAEAALALAAIQLTHDLQRDIEQRRALETQLTYQAFHDALTGLPNRLLFGERTQRAFDQARLTARPVAVLFIDLDGFKAINDSLGHAAGDQLLVEVAGRLSAASTEGTLVARLGGDEFAVLVEEVDDPATPMRLAEDVLASLSRPTWLVEREVIVSVSIGTATSTPETRGADELLRNADTAMYTAKHAGKARCAMYQEGMRGAMLARLDIESGLRSSEEPRPIRALSAVAGSRRTAKRR
jgi:diguanylate cyclase (GGDEF)-like protein